MDQKEKFPIFPMHFRGILLLAGMYTVAWSAFFKWFGPALIKWLAMTDVGTEQLTSNWFGSFGLIVGFVIFISAFYPVSYLYLVLGGIAGKILLAIWFGIEFLPALGWNKRTGFHLLFNELLWIIPMTVVAWRAHLVKKYLDSQEE